MTETAAPTIAAIYRYPVKGLGPQKLAGVELIAGETLPLDRAYAIENGEGRFDPEAPRHFPKTHFLMLMRDAWLAALTTEFDPATHVLTIRQEGEIGAQGALAAAEGRQAIERFMAAYAQRELRGAPKLVTAPGHSFTDKAEKLLHIVNLATVADVEHAMGRRLDPLRFRANLYLDGIEPWAERGWLGRQIVVGPACLEVTAHTGRCAATEVDPATGVRDAAVPAALLRTYGHSDLGVYARVLAGGRIGIGDSLRLAPH